MRTNSGVVTRADGSTVNYSAIPLGGGAFLIQLRKAWEDRERYAYGLGEPQTDGSITLLSPDCSFPQSVRSALRNAGVKLALSFRTCPPSEDSVEALLAQFRVLARNRDWYADGSVSLVPIDKAVGQVDYESLRQAMALALQLPETKIAPAPVAIELELLGTMKDAVDPRLKEWSAAWQYDRYVSGSATPLRVDCHDGRCAVAGTFRFTRFGIFSHTIPFGAIVQRSASGSAIVRSLCYRDDSSRFNDCIGPDRS